MKRTLFTLKRFFVAFSFVLIIYSCSASTGSRYTKDEKVNTINTSQENSENSENSENIKNTELIEDFDITPYKTKITIPEKKVITDNKNPNVWFDYGSPVVDTKTKSLVGTDDGFRVLFLTSDNLEEANQVKADVYFSQGSYEVYIDFEPPFYKVKAGDFDNQKNAEDLRFKLNQLGYKEAKVIKDKINIYK